MLLQRDWAAPPLNAVLSGGDQCCDPSSAVAVPREDRGDSASCGALAACANGALPQAAK